MADVTEIIDYYENLLIVQYHNKPKAQATIRALIEEAIASGILFDIRDGYDVETAVGVQLDVIGKYVGVDRFYEGQDLDGYFAFTDYDEVTPDAGKRGFSEYSDYTSKEGKWLVYDNTLAIDLALNDDDFRILIKLKIVQNNSDHSHKSIDDSIFSAFGSDVIPDSTGNMVMYYFVPYTKSEILKVAIQKEILPRPMAVRLNYLIETLDGFFGFTDYDGRGAGIGFTDYTDFDVQSGQSLAYSNLTAP